MLAIRFQRVGRKGHAEFRVIVQEAQRAPSSGRIVAQIGHYNPHTKLTILDKEKATLFLSNGAQPSDRVASLLQKEGLKLPSWVKIDTSKTKTIKKVTKLRRNQPAQEKAVDETPKTESKAVPVEETPEVMPEESTETTKRVAAEETVTEETSTTETPEKPETAA